MSPNGDPWMAWLREHGAALVLLARQWVVSRANAEDVVQEAFIRFWRSRERIAEPVAYLYACVKHCALDAHRGRQRQLRPSHSAGGKIRRRWRQELAAYCGLIDNESLRGF